MAGNSVDFGRTAIDYRKYRQGFPEAFFSRLFHRNIGLKGQRVLDLGTGTGTVARGFAKAECEVIAIDPAEELIEQAKKIDQELGINNIHYILGIAENIKQSNHSFDVVIAGQCWHWFDAQQAIQEIKRVLKSSGVLIIAHYDWIPLENSVPALSEKLILKYNLDWTMAGGNGFYPRWVNQLAEAGFQDIETDSFDIIADYSHEGWCGRVRASAGVAASLPDDQVIKFDEEHMAALKSKFPQEVLHIPHRCFTVIAHAAAGFTPHFSKSYEA